MRPNFSGVWKVDFTRSAILGEAPLAVRMTIEHDGDKIRQHVTANREAGAETALFIFEIGRETTNFLRGVPMVTLPRWEGAILIIEGSVQTPAKELRFKDHWSLSKDGATLTMEHPDDDLAGQRSVLVRG